MTAFIIICCVGIIAAIFTGSASVGIYVIVSLIVAWICWIFIAFYLGMKMNARSFYKNQPELEDEDGN